MKKITPATALAATMRLDRGNLLSRRHGHHHQLDLGCHLCDGVAWAALKEPVKDTRMTARGNTD